MVGGEERMSGGEGGRRGTEGETEGGLLGGRGEDRFFLIQDDKKKTSFWTFEGGLG